MAVRQGLLGYPTTDQGDDFAVYTYPKARLYLWRESDSQLEGAQASTPWNKRGQSTAMNVTGNADNVHNIPQESLSLSISRWLLYLLILAFPFFSIQPKYFRPDWWIGSLLILAFGATLLKEKRTPTLDPIGKAILGLHIVVILSLIVNGRNWGGAEWTEFATLWLQFLFATLLYFATANLSLSSDELKHLLRLLIGGSVVISVYGVYQVFARNLDLPLAYIPHLNPSPDRLPSGLAFGGYIRPSSFLKEPTYLGMYLLGPLLLTATLIFYHQDHVWLFRSRWMNVAAFSCILLAWIATFSLAAYITLAVLLLGAFLFDRAARMFTLYLGTLIILHAVFFLAISTQTGVPVTRAIVERATRILTTVQKSEMPSPQTTPKQVSQSDGNSSTYDGDSSAKVRPKKDPSTRARLEEAILGFRTWVHYPLFGIGLNQLQFVGKRYAPEDFRQRIVRRGYMHNVWLEVLVQTGIMGALFFLLVWLQGVRMMRDVFRKHAGPLRVLALSMFYVLLALMLRGFWGGPFHFTLYWFYLGLVSMVYRFYRRQHEAPVG